MNIAIIDDDSLVLECVKRAAKNISCNLYCSSDIDDSLDYLCNSTPDVLIVDQRMPQLDGIDFLEQLDAIKDLSQFSAVYLCTSSPPPKNICTRLEAVGGVLMAKTMLCNRKRFTEFLHDVQARPQGTNNTPELSTR